MNCLDKVWGRWKEGSWATVCLKMPWAVLIKGSLKVKLPTIWTDKEADVGRVREKKRREGKRREEKRISEKRKSEEKEEAGARKGRKVAKHCVFPMFWGSEGSKSRLAKAAGRR